MDIKTPADRDLAEHILPLLRGLKLSEDLDLAEAALRYERELTQQLNGNGQEELPFRDRRRTATAAR
jgi:hypothetical protein